jgi:hypothetical protein
MKPETIQKRIQFQIESTERLYSQYALLRDEKIKRMARHYTKMTKRAPRSYDFDRVAIEAGNPWSKPKKN